MAANPPIAATSSAGGVASAANPPVEVTLVIPDPDNPGGWIPDPGGGGGSTTLAGLTDVSVAGAADGQVLGFRQSDGKWVPLDQADHFKGEYSTSASYKAGDFVTYQNELYAAPADISPPSAIESVGQSTTRITGPSQNVPFPAGSAAGDLALAFIAANGSWGGSVSPTTYVDFSGTTSSSFSKGSLYVRRLTSGDIATGAFTVVNSVGAMVSVRTYRGSGLPTVSAKTSANLSASAGSTIPGVSVQSIASGSISVRFFSWYAGGGISGAPAMGAPAANVTTVDPATNTATVISGEIVGKTTIPATDAPVTVPATPANPSYNWMLLELPIGAGFNPGQWTKILARDPRRVTVSDVDYSCTGLEDVVAYTSITTTRTVTLPDPSAVPAGKLIVIRSDTSSGNVLTVSGSGLGAITMVAAGYCWASFRNMGTAGWMVEAGTIQLQSSTASARRLGTGSTDAAAGNDSRLSDPRTPTAAFIAPLRGAVNAVTAASAPITSQAVIHATGTAAQSLTLPTTSSYGTGRELLILDLNSSRSGVVTLTRTSPDTIEGETSLALPLGGWIRLYAADNNVWRIIGRGGRATVVKTTASLATSAAETGTVPLGKGFRLLKVSTDKAARVELYSTAAQMTADAGRAFGVAPTGDHGVILDAQSTSGALTQTVAPAIEGANMESSPSMAISYRITNLDGSTGTVTATFVVVTTEP